MIEVAMRKLLGTVAAVSLASLLAGCSSSTATKQPDRGGGFRTLDAVVVERATETGAQGAMTYYLGFETREGEATVHLRYEVTRNQYLRFTEGTHVKILLADDRLREIRLDTN